LEGARENTVWVWGRRGASIIDELAEIANGQTYPELIQFTINAGSDVGEIVFHPAYHHELELVPIRFAVAACTSSRCFCQLAECVPQRQLNLRWHTPGYELKQAFFCPVS